MMIKKEFVITTDSVDTDGDIILLTSLKMPSIGTLKILDHFDATKKPLGIITELKIQDGKVIATGMLEHDPIGLYPAIGFRSIKNHDNAHGGKTHEEIELMYVGLTPAPNADPNIKPIE